MWPWHTFGSLTSTAGGTLMVENFPTVEYVIWLMSEKLNLRPQLIRSSVITFKKIQTKVMIITRILIFPGDEKLKF